VADSRFTPARRNGAPVTEDREEVFVFVAPTGAGPLEGIVASWSTRADGTPRTVIGQRSADPATTAFLSASALLDAQRAAITELLRRTDFPGPSADPDAILCLTLQGLPEGVEPDPVFVRLSSRRRRVVAGRDCPRTYGIMMRRDDARGGPERMPRGWINPIRIGIRTGSWSTTALNLTIETSWPDVLVRYNCRADRMPEGWRAECGPGIHVTF
jgi:hypothetical protein